MPLFNKPAVEIVCLICCWTFQIYTFFVYWDSFSLVNNLQTSTVKWLLRRKIGTFWNWVEPTPWSPSPLYTPLVCLSLKYLATWITDAQITLRQVMMWPRLSGHDCGHMPELQGLVLGTFVEARFIEHITLMLSETGDIRVEGFNDMQSQYQSTKQWLLEIWLQYFTGLIEKDNLAVQPDCWDVWNFAHPPRKAPVWSTFTRSWHCLTFQLWPKQETTAASCP